MPRSIGSGSSTGPICDRGREISGHRWANRWGGVVKKPPACGGNGTKHRADIIEDAHDTNCANTNTYSHRHTTYSHHFFHTTRFSAHKWPRAAPRRSTDDPCGLGTARAHPRAGPDRPGAGPKLPGAPDTTAHTLAARPARGPVWPIRAPRFTPSRGRPGGRPRRLQRSEHAAHTAACGAALRGRGRGRAGRLEPYDLRPRGVHRGSERA